MPDLLSMKSVRNTCSLVCLMIGISPLRIWCMEGTSTISPRLSTWPCLLRTWDTYVGDMEEYVLYIPQWSYFIYYVHVIWTLAQNQFGTDRVILLNTWGRLSIHAHLLAGGLDNPHVSLLGVVLFTTDGQLIWSIQRTSTVTMHLHDPCVHIL